MRPEHITFTVSTDTPDRETCDFRLTTLMNKEEIKAQCIQEQKDKKAKDELEMLEQEKKAKLAKANKEKTEKEK